MRIFLAMSMMYHLRSAYDLKKSVGLHCIFIVLTHISLVYMMPTDETPFIAASYDKLDLLIAFSTADI